MARDHGADVRAGMGHAGCMSAGDMTSKGTSNTNGHVSADRDKGRDRASDRVSERAQTHIGHHFNRGKHTAMGRTDTHT
nr:hypothetical protein [Paraburkholderia franconis]